MDGVFLFVEEYASLLAKASFCPNFRDDLIKIRFQIVSLPQPEMDPTVFEKLWRDAGAQNLYSCINIPYVQIEYPWSANTLANWEQWL